MYSYLTTTAHPLSRRSLAHITAPEPSHIHVPGYVPMDPVLARRIEIPSFSRQCLTLCRLADRILGGSARQPGPCAPRVVHLPFRTFLILMLHFTQGPGNCTSKRAPDALVTMAIFFQASPSSSIPVAPCTLTLHQRAMPMHAGKESPDG